MGSGGSLKKWSFSPGRVSPRSQGQYHPPGEHREWGRILSCQNFRKVPENRGMGVKWSVLQEAVLKHIIFPSKVSRRPPVKKYFKYLPLTYHSPVETGIWKSQNWTYGPDFSQRESQQSFLYNMCLRESLSMISFPKFFPLSSAQTIWHQLPWGSICLLKLTCAIIHILIT